MTRFACCLLVGLLVAGCEPSWTAVFEGLDSGLVSVWGRSSREVYAVGADDGRGPMVLAFDGEAWRRLATGAQGDLWWVHGVPGGPIYMGGEGGLVVRYEAGAFTRMTTPGTGTVFGIWGSGPSDVWAVGGSGAERGFAWHFDGAAWTDVPIEGLDDRGLYKVWGNGPSDAWFVGARGLIARWDGTAIRAVESPTTRKIFTVHARGEQAIAVGGEGNAVILERQGGAWVDTTPPFTQALFGVWTNADGTAYAVGYDGIVMRRSADGAWSDESEAIDLSPVQALHAVWVDETGGVWAVGGAVLAEPLTNGALWHRGSAIAGGSFQEGS